MDEHVLHVALQLIERALEEDLNGQRDYTSELLIPREDQGLVEIVTRKTGVVCGTDLIQPILSRIGGNARSDCLVSDGQRVRPGDVIAKLQGNVIQLLTAERTILNFMTLLSGISTLTREYVDQVAGLNVQILDTRKTLPGLRVLQKYAVKCGGGTNHRFGLYDAILVKDNHLADWTRDEGRTLTDAVHALRRNAPAGMMVQFEVDNLLQLEELLPENPDMILLDNMSNPQLKEAVRLRNQLAPKVLLEASGGVNLGTVRGIAETGVDRISVGALTHSAPALDLGFDWLQSPA